MNIKSFLIVVMIVALAGCEAAKVRNNVDKLNTSLTEYGAALRWNRLNMAVAYHATRDGEQPAVNIEELEKYSVTSFRPIDPVVNDEGTEATIPIEIDYYDEQYGTLRKIKDTQLWWYEPESKRWFIESDFPVFK